MGELLAGDHRHPCCRNPENLELVSERRREGAAEVCRRCRACGCRHFDLTVDPGVIGIQLSAPG